MEETYTIPKTYRHGIRIIHLKSDYRYVPKIFRGTGGDAINTLLTTAAYNFK